MSDMGKGSQDICLLLFPFCVHSMHMEHSWLTVLGFLCHHFSVQICLQIALMWSEYCKSHYHTCHTCLSHLLGGDPENIWKEMEELQILCLLQKTFVPAGLCTHLLCQSPFYTGTQLFHPPAITKSLMMGVALPPHGDALLLPSLHPSRLLTRRSQSLQHISWKTVQHRDIAKFELLVRSRVLIQELLWFALGFAAATLICSVLFRPSLAAL